MQSARIWFNKDEQPYGLSDMKADIEAIGLKVRDTQWKLQSIVVPQLHVAADPPFLVQLNDDEYVVEEAQEAASSHKDDLSPSIRSKLVQCDARFEIGDGNQSVLTTPEGVFSFEGWTSLDPGIPEIRRILSLITEKVGGVFEDNVNGFWWTAS